MPLKHKDSKPMGGARPGAGRKHKYGQPCRLVHVKLPLALDLAIKTEAREQARPQAEIIVRALMDQLGLAKPE